jgi:hypothetical protein|tara:strand:+ start:261 stop:467 length:207 start_codon:yes stop_codon:yes gene_type:complete
MVIKKGWASLQLINEWDLEDKLFHELTDEEQNQIVFDIEEDRFVDKAYQRRKKEKNTTNLINGLYKLG